MASRASRVSPWADDAAGQRREGTYLYSIAAVDLVEAATRLERIQLIVFTAFLAEAGSMVVALGCSAAVFLADADLMAFLTATCPCVTLTARRAFHCNFDHATLTPSIRFERMPLLVTTIDGHAVPLPGLSRQWKRRMLIRSLARRRPLDDAHANLSSLEGF